MAALGARSIVLVGMMGAGKSSIGRRLAARLGIPFVDADTEIEEAAGMTIPDIFATHGEPYFRAGEARVIARLLDGGPQVLATGGGAFMNADTRAADRGQGHLGLAQGRVRGADAADQAPARPAAAQDRRSRARRCATLMAERYPVYAQADVTVQSRDVPHDMIVDEIVSALARPGRGCRAAGEAARTGSACHDGAAARRANRIVVDVALGARSYDIVIGRGLLRLARRAHRGAAAGCQGGDRHRRDGGAASSARRAQAALALAGIATPRRDRRRRARAPRASPCSSGSARR